MDYVPNTDRDRAEMLQAVGVDSVDALFEELLASVPEHLRHPAFNLPSGMSEPEVRQLLAALAAKNVSLDRCPCFLGAGAYRHYTPSVVNAVISRNEFYTSYTPYQPELSQGLLQSIYEYQSLVCTLLGMDVSNASMYDGATALAEAVLMACNVTGRGTIVVPDDVPPEWIKVIHSYTLGQGLTVRQVRTWALQDGVLVRRPRAVLEALDADTACVVVQNPGYFGWVVDPSGFAEAVHAAGALLVASCADPVALGLLAAPGEYGADIAVAEGQSLGAGLNFGGPRVGLFACREQFVRLMPGRIAGMTVDREGRRGFVLTLQTREQHIRRERATSNICTNEALVALAASVYLAYMGPQGLRRVAELCYHKAHYLAEQIARVPGFALASPEPFFHEFVVRCPAPAAAVNRLLLQEGIIGGYDLGRYAPELANYSLWCATELTTRDEIDRAVQALAVVSDRITVRA
jgi:glycine dehydrogenase subunit 1